MAVSEREPDLVIERLPDWNYGAFLDDEVASCIAIGETEQEALNNGMRELMKRAQQKGETMPKGEDKLAAEIIRGLENRGYMDLQFNVDDAIAAREFVAELLLEDEEDRPTASAERGLREALKWAMGQLRSQSSPSRRVVSEGPDNGDITHLQCNWCKVERPWDLVSKFEHKQNCPWGIAEAALQSVPSSPPLGPPITEREIESWAVAPSDAGQPTDENWWNPLALEVIRHARTNEPHDKWQDWQNAIVGGLLRAYNRGQDSIIAPAPRPAEKD